MDKTLKVAEQLAKNLGLNPEDIEKFEDRYMVSDGFTTLIASSLEDNLKMWPEVSAKFLDIWWEQKESNTKKKPKSDYEEAIRNKLEQCVLKPSIDVLYEGVEDGVDYIVYTDTIDAMVLESEKFKGGM